MNLMHFAIHALVDAGQGQTAPDRVVDLPSATEHREQHAAGTLRRGLHALGRRARSALAWLRDRRDTRRALAALDRLDDHLLRDIGLRRGDLDAVRAGLTSLDALEVERRAHRPLAPPIAMPHRHDAVATERPEELGLARSA